MADEIIKVPEKELPIVSTVADNDFVRIVTIAGESKRITFLESVKTYVNSIISSATDKMLKSDGSVLMDTGYSPAVDLAIATKKYVVDTVNSLASSINALFSDLRTEINAKAEFIQIFSSVNTTTNTASLLPIGISTFSQISPSKVLQMVNPSIDILTTDEVYQIDVSFFLVSSANSTFVVGVENIDLGTVASPIGTVQKAVSAPNSVGTYVQLQFIGTAIDSFTSVMMNTAGGDVIYEELTVTIKRLTTDL